MLKIDFSGTVLIKLHCQTAQTWGSGLNVHLKEPCQRAKSSMNDTSLLPTPTETAHICESAQKEPIQRVELFMNKTSLLPTLTKVTQTCESALHIHIKEPTQRAESFVKGISLMPIDKNGSCMRIGSQGSLKRADAFRIVWVVRQMERHRLLVWADSQSRSRRRELSKYRQG